MIKLTNLLTEIGEGTIPYKWSGPEEDSVGIHYYFKTEDGDYYLVTFTPKASEHTSDNAYRLDFYAKDGDGGFDSGIVINKGRQFRIISTIMDIIPSFIKEYPCDMILFSGSDKRNSKNDTNQRDMLYKKYVSKNIHKLEGWKFDNSTSTTKLFRTVPLPGIELKR